jgi:V/A-type H+/Na+-transporting ATPase subunit B
MNASIRLYADATNAKTKRDNGFELSDYDKRAILFSKDYASKLLAVDVDIDSVVMLDTAWDLFAKYFDKSEVAIKQAVTEKYWKGK